MKAMHRFYGLRHLMPSRQSTLKFLTPVAVSPGHVTGESYGAQSSLSVPCRSYAKKYGPRKPPSKPLKFEYAGDLEHFLQPVDPTAPKAGFENIPELESASEDVKRIFSLEFSDGTELKDKRLEAIVEAVQEHPADVQSLEVRIAKQTILIRNQLPYCKEYRKDKVAKSQLIERIQARKRNLTILRDMDYEKFEWLLKQLRIKYEPTPMYNFPVSKRAARIKAARDQMFAMREAKMAAFRKKLEDEKVSFLDYKEKELAKISEELKELGAPSDVSLKKQLKALNIRVEDKKEPQLSSRRRILNKKFELWELSRRQQNQDKEV